jgi:signal transduction histidine kinase
MSLPGWLRTPRSLLAVFLVIVLLPSALLVVSGWRLMRHEAEAERQARREQMAGEIVTTLQQRVEEIVAQLRDRRSELAVAANRDDFVFAVFTGGRIETTPSRRLLYYPITVVGHDASLPAIAEAAHLRRLGQTDAALAALSRAAAPWDASVAGIPADLFARWAECDLLAEAGRTDELKRKAEALYAELMSGRWQLSRAVFYANAEDAARWSGTTALPAATEHAGVLAAAIERLWQRWSARPATLSGSGHELVTLDGRTATLVWYADDHRLAAFAAGSGFIDAQWLSDPYRKAERQELSISLRQPGSPHATAHETRRPAEETRLPWTVAVANVVPASAVTSGRLQIWIGGVALLSLIVIGGATVITRATSRELIVARLQSDFVAAVSHEFRTPLTSLRQIGEALHDGRVSDARRRTYYEALVRQTERLHHLVETLLDFGRMEAGRSPYRKEPTDLVPLARSIVEQFNHEVSGRGYTVELATADEPIVVLSDQQALTNALWNLLDNAVKYSPDCRTVWVTLARRKDTAELSVRDHGLGIPRGERREIFGKFVRGAEAKRQNIAGTGIGLAMVQYTVKAHGGHVRVESQVGSGSTFTLEIPCHAS